jgi:hypothetical protein
MLRLRQRLLRWGGRREPCLWSITIIRRRWMLKGVGAPSDLAGLLTCRVFSIGASRSTKRARYWISTTAKCRSPNARDAEAICRYRHKRVASLHRLRRGCARSVSSRPSQRVRPSAGPMTGSREVGPITTESFDFGELGPLSSFQRIAVVGSRFRGDDSGGLHKLLPAPADSSPFRLLSDLVVIYSKPKAKSPK